MGIVIRKLGPIITPSPEMNLFQLQNSLFEGLFESKFFSLSIKIDIFISISPCLIAILIVN